MNKREALKCIESLRKGIPPDNYIRYFTVGRKEEIEDLKKRLGSEESSTLLLKANYGSGKTHLLKFIREEALEQDYAVSYVVVDANSAVRFNRMDQIFAAVCRNLQVPGIEEKGLRSFFDYVLSNLPKDHMVCEAINNDWSWDFDEVFDSPALLIALRAWNVGDDEIKNLIEDWLYNPWNYVMQKKKLYNELIYNLKDIFKDIRPESIFYRDRIFIFYGNGYDQSWAALRDLHMLALASGLEGLIILFDEFEDVINNLKRIDFKEAAFWNLFRFYRRKDFIGKTFFAVTPDFYQKCKEALMNKNGNGFDFKMLKSLPTYEMSPLGVSEIEELALKILDVHGLAYDWEPDYIMKAKQLKYIVEVSASKPIPDRVRYTIKTVVRFLDNLFEDYKGDVSGRY